VLPSFREIASAVSTMLDREQFERIRARVKAFDNRAVFEIPEILEALISRQYGKDIMAAAVRNQISDVSRFYRDA
jgi:hypothetical protein